MAFSGTPHNSYPHLNPPSSSFSSLSLSLNPQSQFPPFFKPFNFKPCCSNNNTTPFQTDTNKPQHLNVNLDVQKKKRKPKPSFYEQIRDKWSVKPISQTKKLPWHLEEKESSPEMVGKLDSEVESSKLSAQMIDGTKVEEPIFDSGGIVEQILSNNTVSSSFNNHRLFSSSFDEKNKFVEAHLDNTDENCSEKDHSVEFCEDLGSNSLSSSFDETSKVIETQFDITDDNRRGINNNVVESYGHLVNNVAFEKLVESRSHVEGDVAISRVKEEEVPFSRSEYDVHHGNSLHDKGNSESSIRSSADRLPWMPESDRNTGEEERRKRGKTKLAEKVIPEHELRRLRNVALRMKERIKVGAAGVTQAVVDTVHEKWKIDEVVKLKFEGPPTMNMKRVHEILESKTGGLVIWRSGSSVVLYRGLTYKLDCVQTYIKEKGEKSEVSLHAGKSVPGYVGFEKYLSEEELIEMSELNKLLDELGPRYADWSGRPPLPVDADLLPGVVPGYKTPFRLLPHGVRRSLRDEETTNFRRQARIMPPHFALGRNRELQGLAAGMVKLWEKTAIAKIAIKRGVLNTVNERMAEELKRLTGGTLLSRNKEFIVFYRGNDFLPPPVTQSLRERERLTMLQYQEEDARRYASVFINPNSNCKVPMVAGTLAETVAATSRWAKQTSSEDVEKMMKDSAVGRRASLVKNLQKKLAIAKRKFKKAEEALEKVQEYLEPEELPTDLETITDEERLVFRKMGLSMKPHLLLGRREVFDGTIENMHMHWKFRELVKINVRGKNFAQVKHIAISLEAESGGLLVSIDKTTKGYAIIVYRGKNYKQPVRLKPRNLLTRRQALARSIELQRREGLKHHISDLQEQMELVKSELEYLECGKELDDKTFYEKLDDSSIPSDDDMEEDEGEEAYLQTYDSEDEKNAV